MKKILTLVLVFSTAFLACGFSGSTSKKALARSLYGRIFVAKNRREADCTVYVVRSESEADLRVYKTSGASSPGLWDMTDKRREADFVIFYETKSMFSADIYVYFVNSRHLAGPAPSYR